MATCSVCQAEVDSGAKCKRCDKDNTDWIEFRGKETDEQLGYFFPGVFGIVVVALILASILIVYFAAIDDYFNARTASSLWSVFPGGSIQSRATVIMAQVLATFSVFLTAFVVYILRFELWYYHWLQQVYKPPRPRISSIALLSLGVGIGSLLIYFCFIVIAPATTVFPFDFLHKIIMPGLYILVFLCVSGGIMFLLTARFVDRLDKGIPYKGAAKLSIHHPIYSDTNLLTQIVLKDALNRLELQEITSETIVKLVKDNLKSQLRSLSDDAIDGIARSFRRDLEEQTLNDKERLVLIVRDTAKTKLQARIPTDLKEKISGIVKEKSEERTKELERYVRPLAKKTIGRELPLQAREYISQTRQEIENVVIEALQEKLNSEIENLSEDIASETVKKLREKNVEVCFRVHSAKRTDTGGIQMILARVDVNDPGKVDRRYDIEANKWGQILALLEKAVS